MNTASDLEPGLSQQPGSKAEPEAGVWADLADLPDPEIPVLTLMDLGILRWVRCDDSATTVGIAPTYTGCPATEFIEASVLERLRQRGHVDPKVERVLSPAWTTDWISAEGRQKLKDYGIAPPAAASGSRRALLGASALDIACPRCNTTNTQRVSEFGSTPCKASYKCRECLEPFEYFKCI